MLLPGWRAMNVAAMGGGASIIDPGTLDPFIWYDPSDLDTVFQDHLATVPVTASGQAVGALLSKISGGNGSIQPDSGLKPTFFDVGGARWVESLTGDYLDDTSISEAPPLTFVSAWQIVAYPGDFAFLWGSGANQMYGGLTITPTLLQMTGDNFGNFLSLSVPAEGVDFIVAQVFNGASSKLQIIGGASTTGNADGGNNTLSGTNLFARSQDKIAAARLYGMIAVEGVLDDGVISQLAAFLQTKLP